MEIKYTKCKKCFLVYDENIKTCPRCGNVNPIQEDLDNNNKENLFNICD